MAADLGLVAHAAQRLAGELAARGARDRAAERGLADARRADQAQDRALQPVGAGLDREIFDDPLLDLLQAVMVLVEDPLGLGDVVLQLAISCPTAGRAARRDSCGDRRLGRHRRHRAQLLQLGIGAVAGFLAKPGLADLGGQLGELVAALLALIAELALDRLQLLVQIIFALGLLHLPLDAAADLLLDLQHAELALHEGEHHFQPARRIQLAEQGLLVGDLDRQLEATASARIEGSSISPSWMPVSAGSRLLTLA